jgi:hypothetical protein
MGNETRWPRSAVSFDARPSQKGGLHPARSGEFTPKRKWAVGPFFVIVTVDRCTISPFPSCPRVTL